jgi:SAM-dependent methyltransferase
MTGSAFTGEQFDAIYPDGIGGHYWNHARNRIIVRFLRKYKRSKDRILEIGCGRGVVVEYLRAAGINCVGVELGDVKPFPGVRDFVFAGKDAFALPAELRQNIDTILLMDVIEHLENPRAFLDEIRKSFVKARHILVTVPARQELWTNYDDYNGHFRRYNLRMIHDLCADDLRLTKSGYFNHMLYPVFWIFARLVKKRATVIRAPKGRTVILHRILSFILQSDFALIPAHMPGTSLIALFEAGR